MYKVKKEKRANWTPKEICILIDIWRDYVAQLKNVKKNNYLYKEISKKLDAEYALLFDPQEIRFKVNNLTQRYRSEKRLHEHSGCPSEWPYYEKIDNILANVSRLNNLDPSIGEDSSICEETMDSTQNHVKSDEQIEASEEKKNVEDDQEGSDVNIIDEDQIQLQNFAKFLEPQRHVTNSTTEETNNTTHIKKEQTDDDSSGGGQAAAGSGENRKRKSSNTIKSINRAIQKLSRISDNGVNSANEPHEFDVFCNSLAIQLKKMPLREALICQNKLQTVMTEYRLYLLAAENDVDTPASMSSVGTLCEIPSQEFFT